jgi:CHAT domain-containing protein/tetratricopeptide (TPR) repeat protein
MRLDQVEGGMMRPVCHGGAAQRAKRVVSATALFACLLASILVISTRPASAQTDSPNAPRCSADQPEQDPNRTIGFENYREFRDNAAALVRIGYPGGAEDLLVRTIAWSECYFGGYHPATLDLLADLSKVYLEQGRHGEALGIAQRVYSAQNDRYRERHPLTALASLDVAAALEGLGDLEEAERLYRQAVSFHTDPIARFEERTVSSFALGRFLLNRGAYPEAEPLLRSVVDERLRYMGAANPQTVSARRALAELLLRTGRHAEAEPLLAELLVASQSLFNRDGPNTVRVANLLTESRLGTGDVAGGVAASRDLLQRLRWRRSRYQGIGFSEADDRREHRRLAPAYTLVADAFGASYTRQPDPVLREDAFFALQESISNAGSDAVAQHVVRRLAAAAGGQNVLLVEARDQAESAFREAALAEQAFSTSRGANEVRATSGGALAEARRRLLAADRALREAFPAYREILRNEPLTIAETQALLGPREAILMVVPSAFGTHSILIRQDRYEWVRSPLTRADVNDAVQRLRWDLGATVAIEEETRRAWEEGAVAGSFDRRSAYNLYRALIHPLAGHLADLDDLFVVAGGSLAGLPFHVLVTRPPEGEDADPAALRRTSWFGDTVPLTHVPSIRSLALLRRLPGEAGRSAAGYVGIGDPALEGAPAARTRGLGVRLARSGPGRGGATRSGATVADVASLRALPRLPGTARELEAVRRTLGDARSSLLLGSRATETNVRAQALDGVRLIIFSTHGLTADEATGIGEAGLVLTPPENGSPRDDGYLTASEVSDLRFDVDWAILSACNTATGDEGESFGALVRAFFAAGARNVLASHWPVSDDTAPVLISNTLEREQSGVSRARAFQLAMRDVRMNDAHDAAGGSWAHPFFWAPFVLLGAGR